MVDTKFKPALTRATPAGGGKWRSGASSRGGYSRAARALHWTIALLIAGMYITDRARGAFPAGSSERTWWLTAHESLGLLVLLLSVVRLTWRLSHAVPPIPGTPFVRSVARAAHALLYIATLGLPVAGVGRAMAGGGNVAFFGLTIPSWTGRNQLIAWLTGLLHGGFITNLLLALIAGHALAALWHQFCLKDGTLQRMM